MSRGLTKEALRRWVRERRAALDTAWCAEQSALVQTRLLSLPVMTSVSRVGVYMECAGEAELATLRDVLADKGVELFVPAYHSRLKAYALARLEHDTRFKAAPFGLREPECPEWADGLELDCIVTPGVAFDATGRRIGHGGGHYDRMLAGTTALKVGVAFDFQLVDEVPAEPHDVAMDWVITPTCAYEAENMSRLAGGGFVVN